MKSYILFLLIFFFILPVNSESIGTETGLKIPRFVSLKSDDSNLRIGSSKNFPIRLKYIIANVPLEIIEEYDVWRKLLTLKKTRVGFIKA